MATAAPVRRAQRAPHNPPPVARRYYTVEQAADFYGVNPRTIRRWLTENKLTAYRVGGHLLRLDAAEVEALAVRCDPSDVSA
ncbi:helix-turn-helix domain-containing protein [Blastococcus sp. KM273128]|uniref:helix-turn-helix domain-containing protein n=1 Tax=Blastococcus sp. KM273128 TaxID=2570314 RepID=UPI001F2C0D7C|nr:helix-turn-helix domain-containing protein [Blastococcus sp. KM273128]